LYELIDRRHHTGSLIVTANRAPKDWYPLFPNPVIAESALDRLISGAHMITLTGKSYRSMLRPNTCTEPGRSKDLEKEAATM
ncbi:MAG: ATP-binding protein, partial [Chloroflexi bacterium]|nr:ATP-binding protein [Chloroflexota bacterium]